MRIYHLALESDWEAAQPAGEYRVSTLDRSLEEVGFIHCSHEDQWEQVSRDVYGEAHRPMVLLVVDTDRLTAPVRDELVPGSDRPFPHVYGPLALDAIVEVRRLPHPRGQ